MKDILIITQHFLPESVGRATRIHGLAKFLTKFHRVRILAPPPTWPFKKHKRDGFLYRKENFDGMEIIRLWTHQPSKTIPSFFDNVGYLLGFPILASIFLLIKSHGVSTVILSTPTTYVLLVTLVARLLHKKIILDVGDLEYNQDLFVDNVRKHHFLKKLMKRFEMNAWRKSDLILTNNMVIHDIIEKVIKVKNSSKVIYFPFIADLNVFKKQNVPRQNQIVYVGMLGPLQNLEPLIRAMPIILKKIPDMKLLLYGGGTSEPQLQNLVRELKLESSCQINQPVPRDEIPLILSRSLMGIVSLAMDESLSFATPTKTFEYLSCGLPVFAYGPSDELERILNQSGGGKLVRSNDHKEIAEEIIRMQKDSNILENFSFNGRNFVKKSVDYSRVAELM